MDSLVVVLIMEEAVAENVAAATAVLVAVGGAVAVMVV